MTRRTTPLRDVIEKQLNVQWSTWAKAHPNLAAAIDRTRLVESAVSRVRDDPAFEQAMRTAGLDEARLAAAAELLEQIDRQVRRVLSI